MAKTSATIDLNGLKVAGENATGYITQITDGGIKVHDKNDEDNFVQITSSNMQIYKDNISVANFGDIVQIGKVESANATFGSDYFALKNEKSVPVLLYESSEATTTESAREVVQQVGMHGFSYTIQGTPLNNQPIKAVVMLQLGATSIIRNTVSFTAGTSETVEVTNPVNYGVIYNATNNTVAIATSGQYVVGINYVEYLVSTSAPTLSFGTTNPMDDPISKGAFSSSFGQGLTAFGDNQTVIGKYNRNDTNSDYAFIIGNGDGWINTTLWRGNALTVDWSGNLTLKDHDSPVGTIVENGNPSSYSYTYSSGSSDWEFPAASSGNAILLTPGVWSITAYARLVGLTAAKQYGVCVGTSTTNTASDFTARPTTRNIVHSNSTLAINLQATMTLEVTENTYVRTGIWHGDKVTIGNSTANNIYTKAVRIV